MDIFFNLLKLVVVLVAGYLLAMKVIPWIYVKAARRLGFKAEMTPITLKRVERFKRIKRGYWAFKIIVTLFVVSLFLELVINNKALAVYYDGKLAFPAVAEWIDGVLFFTTVTSFQKRDDFGQNGEEEVDYRRFQRDCADGSGGLAEIAKLRGEIESIRADAPDPGPGGSKFAKRKYERALRKIESREEGIRKLEAAQKVFRDGSAWVLMPVYPYSPYEFRHEFDKNPPNPPSLSEGIPFGTDVSGRDVLVLMIYGFRISLAFALVVAACGYTVGIIVGGIMGYYGGWTDIGIQRLVEIWGSIPFLFTIMIIASIVKPSFLLLAVLLVVLRSWLSMTYYLRAEFYREKAKDYVQAAVGAGVSDWKIMIKHILPNSLVPVVTFAPFGIVAYIGSLVSLDYLGFGLPPGTPSWGALLKQGLENVKFYPHLTYIPSAALMLTLFCVVMIGEAVREAFDPKVFSRLR